MSQPYTLAQIRGAIGAARALAACAKSHAMRRHWEEAEAHWQRRLRALPANAQLPACEPRGSA